MGQRGNGPRGRSARRLAGTAGCLGAAAAIAAHSAGATFSGSGSVTQSPGSTAGDLYLTQPAYSHAPGVSNTAVANRLQLAVDDLIPVSNTGRDRVVDITNAGDLNFASLTLTVNVTSSSSPNGGNIATDANGVKVWIQTCSTDYTEAGSTPDYTYTCGGSASDVLGASTNYGTYSNFAQAGSACLTGCTLSNLNLTAGAVNHLRFVFKISTSAPANVQASSFQATLTFNGTQRTATTK